MDAPYIIVVCNSLCDQWVDELSRVYAGAVMVSAYVGMGTAQSRAAFAQQYALQKKKGLPQIIVVSASVSPH